MVNNPGQANSLLQYRKLSGQISSYGHDPNDGQTLQQQVYLRIRHAILSGQFKPGASITLRGLAKTFDVSLTPIREAVRLLSAERALEIQDNRRIKTPGMTKERFDELIRLRIIMESHAARRSFPYITRKLIDELERTEDGLEQMIVAKERESVVVSNFHFHHQLYSANPHDVSLVLIESIWLQLGPFLGQCVTPLADCYQFDRHKDIIAALRAGDEEALVAGIEADILELVQA